MIKYLLTLTAFLVFTSCSNQDAKGSREIYSSELIPGYKGLEGWSIMLPIPPNGDIQLTVFKSSEYRAMLEEINSNWDDLWPKLKSRLEEGTGKDGYNTEQRIDGESFSMQADLVESDAFMSDESDYVISFSFEKEVPVWDAFIRGKEVTHFQPVY